MHTLSIQHYVKKSAPSSQILDFLFVFEFIKLYENISKCGSLLFVPGTQIAFWNESLSVCVHVCVDVYVYLSSGKLSYFEAFLFLIYLLPWISLFITDFK